MAVITKSEIVVDREQPDGSRKVMERHERNDGFKPYIVHYTAGNKDDVEQRMLDRVLELEQMFVEEALARDENAARQSSTEKVDGYLKGLSDAELAADVGLDAKEIEIVKGG